MIMTGFQECSMKKMKTKTSITVKKISKTNTINKSNLMKVIIRMNI